MGFLMAALVGAVALLCAAQAPRARMHHAPSAVARTEPDPQITAALKMVSAQKVRQDIEKLVSFYTRQTLSANQPEHTGWGSRPRASGSSRNLTVIPRPAAAASG